jgi:hypothetical protein
MCTRGVRYTWCKVRTRVHGSITNGSRNNERRNMPSMTISRSTNESHAMSQIAKTYQSRNKFSGAFEDDLCESLQTFEKFSEMHGLSEPDKSVLLPIMLDGDALSFYAAAIPKDAPYTEKVQIIQAEYTSEEQGNIFLRL